MVTEIEDLLKQKIAQKQKKGSKVTIQNSEYDQIHTQNEKLLNTALGNRKNFWGSQNLLEISVSTYTKFLSSWDHHVSATSDNRWNDV